MKNMDRCIRRIGFDRRIRKEWLDFVAAMVAEGHSTRDVVQAVDRFLAAEGLKGEARRKTKTLVVGIWEKIPDHLVEFRKAAVKLHASPKVRDAMVVHWGMCMAAYPFFAFVVHRIGRLFRLQGDATLAQIRRRVVEKYGETERVERSTRHVTQSLRSWKILESRKPGQYVGRARIPVDDPETISWLVEAHLHSSETSSGAFDAIVKSPAFFPFETPSISTAALRRSGRLDIIQHGLDENLIMLSNSSPVRKRALI